MKIMIVSSLYGVKGGGSGVIAQHLAHGLADVGHEISVVTMGISHRYSVSDEQGIKLYRFNPINLYKLEEKDMHPTWQKLIWQLIDVYNVHSANMFRKIILKESPDIIHINKMRGFSGAVWSVSTHLNPGRVVQTCHDYESMSPDGILRGSIGKMALKKKWPVRGYQLIRSKLSSNVSIVTSPSRFTLERITGSGLFPLAHAMVVPNTHGWSDTELESIQEQNCKPYEKEVRFLFIGRLEAEKGIKELCDAFLQLSASFPSVHLDIAGYGTLDRYLQEKYKENPGIHFLDFVDGQSKKEALCKATVVIVPSLVNEVFGLVVIEAFAFGKPVIASDIGGLPELIRDGKTGWLVKAGHVQSLREKLESVIKLEPKLLTSMSENCKTYSFEYSKDKIIKKYETIYYQLLR